QFDGVVTNGRAGLQPRLQAQRAHAVQAEAEPDGRRRRLGSGGAKGQGADTGQETTAIQVMRHGGAGSSQMAKLGCPPFYWASSRFRGGSMSSISVLSPRSVLLVDVQSAGPVGEDALDDGPPLRPRQPAVAGPDPGDGDARHALAVRMGPHA